MSRPHSIGHTLIWEGFRPPWAQMMMQSQDMTTKVAVKVLKIQVLRAEGKNIKDALNTLIQVLDESKHIWDVF